MTEYTCRDCGEDWDVLRPYCAFCGSPWKNEIVTDEDPKELEYGHGD